MQEALTTPVTRTRRGLGAPPGTCRPPQPGQGALRRSQHRSGQRWRRGLLTIRPTPTRPLHRLRRRAARTRRPIPHDAPDDP
jgi:hypothetical protein